MAAICPVCNQKVRIFKERWRQGKPFHPDCVKEFDLQPEKYVGTDWEDQVQVPSWEDQVQAPSNSEPSDKDFVITLLICVFLGGLGVHRFFVDKIGTGVLMLVTLGGLGLWWIIDIILIVTGSFKDSEGRVIAYQAAGTVNREPAKDIPAEIRKFAELKKDGLISEEEFDKKKEELLR